MPIFSSKREEIISLIIDIQSDLIRAALAVLSRGGKPRVFYMTSYDIPFEPHASGAHINNSMLKAVSDISNKILKEGMKKAHEIGFRAKKPENVHYILSSPWAIPKSKISRTDFDKPTEITESMILGIMKEERKIFLDEFKKDNKSGEYEFDLAFIEEKVFDIKLNGYSVSDYKGKKATSLEISFATTLSSEKTLDKVHSAVTGVMHIKNESYHSAVLMRYTALRSLLFGREDYISIHIHGELTDMIIVKRGLSYYLGSFPFGRKTLLRKAQASLRASLETTDSSLSMYEDNKLEQEERQKIEKTINLVMRDWQKECMNIINSVSKDGLPPHTVYMSSFKHSGIFKKSLEEKNFEVLPFDDSFMESEAIFDGKPEKNSIMGIYALSLNDMV